MQNSLITRNYSLNIKGTLLELCSPKIMGILNATPDSFYEGSRANNITQVLHKAEKMLEDGAHFLDIGGFSTRPNAEDVNVTEEIERVIPFIEAISKEFVNVIISIDTFRSTVAKHAVEAGASIINDISGGQADEAMFETVAKLKVPYVLMHMRGTPATMMNNLTYDNVTTQVVKFFAKQFKTLNGMGHNDIIIDPGFGFSKTLDQNYELLKRLNHLQMVGYPLLIGVSRKSMIYKLLKTSPEMALNGTSVLNFATLEKGARILRVHDVKEAWETIELFSAINH